ncbi:MAG: hypothetical protein EBR34_06430 [Sphingomonadaceae bacterium]|nr:hypothetical protein [Sphingomonadaceae bacterium]
MLGVQFLVVGILLVTLAWPQLPFSRMIISGGLVLADWLDQHCTRVRGLLGIGLALLLFAVIWALQGDAPMFLAMILPELSAWFATFEIATLTEAVVGLGSAIVAARAAGLHNYLRGRVRAHRSRPARNPIRQPVNDDDRIWSLLVAA